jgi:hypothetical protein
MNVARTVSTLFQTSAGVTNGNNLTLNGTCQINAGGFFTGAPTYGSSSLLKYNTTGTYGRGSEWSATSGAGYPANVQISNNTTLDLGNGGTGTARQCSADLTIDAGSALTMNNGGNAMTAALTVNGNFNFAGTLTLSSLGGGDIKVGGNWVFTTGGAFNSNGRAAFFIGSGTQTISRSAAGTFNFDYLVNVNTVSGVKLSTGTNVNINGAGNGLQLLDAGTFDLNGNACNLQSGVNIQINGTRTITSSSGTGVITVNGGACNVNGSGSLSLASSVRMELNNGFDFGGLTTVNGTLQINNFGYVSNPPTYGTGSLLKYNNGVAVGRGNEWNSGSGAGYPYHVQLSNNTTLDPGSIGFTGVTLNCAGNLTIDGGSAMYLDYGGHNMTVPLIVNGNINIDGTLGESQALGGDIKVRGNWNRTGSFVLHQRAVFFDGTGAQAMNGTTTFDYVRVDKTGSDLTLNANMLVNLNIELKNGKVVTGANRVVVNDGGNATRINGWINGTEENKIPNTAGPSSDFQIGDTNNPAAINLSFIGNVSGSGSITATTTGGDHPNIGRSSLANTKTVNRYWTMTNSSVSFSTYNATFNYVTADVDVIANPANFIVGKYNGSSWGYPSVGTKTSNSTQITGESSFSDFEVGEPGCAPASLSTSVTNVNCYGQSTGAIDLTTTGGSSPFTFSWSNAATTEDVTGLAAGTYTVTVFATGGCSSTTTATVTEPSAPLVAGESHTDVNCFGQSTGSATISATGGTAPYSGTGTFTNLPSGTTTYTVTDSKGCTSTVSVTISQPSAALVASETHADVNCFGQSTGTATISATGGTAPYTGTGTFSNLPAGTTTYTVTDANNCTSTVSVTISQPVAALVASETHTNVLCNGQSTGTATISATGGTAPYSGTGTFTNLPAGTTTYTVTDNKGCTSTVSVTITQPSAISLNETHYDVSCNGGNNGSINLTVSGGTPYQTISASENFNTLATSGTANAWTDGTTIANWYASVGGSTPATYTGATGTATAGGLYSFGVAGVNVVTDRAIGSISSNTSGNILGAWKITNTTGSTLTSITVTYAGEQWRVNGNTAAQSLAFDYQVNATNINSGSWTPVAALTFTTPITAGTSALDGNASANRVALTSTFAISLPAGQAIWLRWTDVNDSGNDHSLGIDDLSATLTAGTTNPYLYSWSPGGATTEDISSLTANTYTVAVSDANNCQATTSVTVTEPAALSASATEGTILCNGGTTTVTVGATGGTTPYGGDYGVHTVSAGPYSFTVTDANGCQSTVSGNISQPTALSASASEGTILCNGGTTTVTVGATGGTSPYSGTGVINSVPAGTYTYTVTDANSCSATVTKTITQPTAVTFTYGTVNNSSCTATGNGSITVTASGGTGA